MECIHQHSPEVSDRRDGPVASRASEGARRLLAAVLADAIDSYRKYAFSGTRRGRRLFEETEAWFMSEEHDADITFATVCEYLDLDARRLRESLIWWRATQAVASSPRAVPGAALANQPMAQRMWQGLPSSLAELGPVRGAA